MFELIEETIGNRSITEKGAIGYASTKSTLLDMNYQINRLRYADEEEIIKLFDKAYYEDKKYALKWLFYVRDIREGMGERRIFRVCYARLLELNIDLFYKNLKIISEYGRWDDSISLIGISEVTDKRIINIINIQLIQDYQNMGENKPISLLCKWLPSENTSSKKTRILARHIIKLMDTSPRKYRLFLSAFRKYLDVVEVKMCNKEWEAIDYSKVPSLANLKYNDAFIEHDAARRLEYLDSVKMGKSKLNMNVATPVDIVSKYKYGEFNEFLELAWSNLKDIQIKDTLVVADGSGSMSMRVDKNVTALDVAHSLAIYSSEHNSNVYKNKYITFSNNPQFVDLTQCTTLHEKLLKAHEYSEISNTNIKKVFDLILTIALENNVSCDEMIKNVLIISDMEFDKAQRGWHDDVCLTKPLFEQIKEEYKINGYELPKLIFWNVNSRTNTIPMLTNDLGVILVSGFSQNTLKMIMSEKYNPLDVLKETLDNERYDLVKTE